MKAKAGVSKDNVFTKLLKAPTDDISIITQSANRMAVFYRHRELDSVKITYKQHRYHFHTNETTIGWNGRRHTSMRNRFSLQWFKNGKLPKSRRR